MLEISTHSREYVKVLVKTDTDPTALPVEMAFVAQGLTPQGADWRAASWETEDGRYYARCLVGPGGTGTIPPGRRTAWVRVTGNPEIPTIRAGNLVVF